MPNNPEIRDLLIDIQKNQQKALKLQEEQLTIAKEQAERSRSQIQESLELQRQGMQKSKLVFRIGGLGIAFCLGLIIYLFVTYF